MLSATLTVLGMVSTPSDAVTLYSVRPQDTLPRIAREHHVSIDQLKRMNADLRHQEKLRTGQVLMIPEPTETVALDSDANVIVIHNDRPMSAHKAVVPHPVASKPLVAVTHVAPSPVPVQVIAAATQPSAPHDTQVIIESDAPPPPTAAAPAAPIVVTDNVAIIDSQIIHVPSAPVPAAPTPSAVSRAGHPQPLASRRGSLVISILSLARRFMGVPYVWGGTTPSGFDCSGFVMRCFALNGIHLQRTADAQYYQGTPVKAPSPGDLVFFSTYLPGPSHVGIYLGGNRFIHASSRRGVTISSLGDPFYASKYIGARRYF